jgi:hypothetical protein
MNEGFKDFLVSSTYPFVRGCRPLLLKYNSLEKTPFILHRVDSPPICVQFMAI